MCMGTLMLRDDVFTIDESFLFDRRKRRLGHSFYMEY